LALLLCENKKQKGKTDIFSLSPSSQSGGDRSNDPFSQ
jgi:hypothetical protein